MEWIKKSHAGLEQLIEKYVQSLEDKQLKFKILSSSKKGALVKISIASKDGIDLIEFDTTYLMPGNSIFICGLDIPIKISIT